MFVKRRAAGIPTKLSPEHRAAIGRGNVGKTMSVESRTKMIAARRGDRAAKSSASGALPNTREIKPQRTVRNFRLCVMLATPAWRSRSATRRASDDGRERRKDRRSPEDDDKTAAQQITPAAALSQLEKMIDPVVRQVVGTVVRGLLVSAPGVPPHVLLNVIARQTGSLLAGALTADLATVTAAPEGLGKDAFAAGVQNEKIQQNPIPQAADDEQVARKCFDPCRRAGRPWESPRPPAPRSPRFQVSTELSRMFTASLVRIDEEAQAARRAPKDTKEELKRA